MHKAAFGEEATKRVEGECTESDDELEIIFVRGCPSIDGGCELESATFEEAAGRAGLILKTVTALDAD